MKNASDALNVKVDSLLILIDLKKLIGKQLLNLERREIKEQGIWNIKKSQSSMTSQKEETSNIFKNDLKIITEMTFKSL